MWEKGLIYQCEVTENKANLEGTTETYIGLTENSFKDRLTKHRSSFRNQGYHRNSLSNHIWDLKRKQVNYDLSWRIVAKAKPYSPTSKTCELCIKEIYYILHKRNMSSLNKRKEFFGHCLHKAKYLLKNQWKKLAIHTFNIPYIPSYIYSHNQFYFHMYQLLLSNNQFIYLTLLKLKDINFNGRKRHVKIFLIWPWALFMELKDVNWWACISYQSLKI